MNRLEQQVELDSTAQEGIALCRAGDWRRGVDLLRTVASNQERSGELSGLFYSYLGYGIARFDRRYREGLRLCRHAVKKEFFHPENFLNLARTHLLTGDRRGAIQAIEEGLRIDPENQDLRDYHTELGVRRAPVLAFLARDHVLNRILGKIRHSFTAAAE